MAGDEQPAADVDPLRPQSMTKYGMTTGALHEPARKRRPQQHRDKCHHQRAADIFGCCELPMSTTRIRPSSIARFVDASSNTIAELKLAPARIAGLDDALAYDLVEAEAGATLRCYKAAAPTPQFPNARTQAGCSSTKLASLCMLHDQRRELDEHQEQDGDG
jgi:hypothetical protein